MIELRIGGCIRLFIGLVIIDLLLVVIIGLLGYCIGVVSGRLLERMMLL